MSLFLLEKLKFGSKNNNTIMLSKKKESTLKSAATPPPLPPSRTEPLSTPPHIAPNLPKKLSFSRSSNMSCSHCGDTKGECNHHYEQITLESQWRDEGYQQYELLQTPSEISGSDINSRLRKIEDNQMRMRSEFNDFRDVVTSQIRSLDTSMKQLMEMNNSLDESMRDSFGYIQSTMEKTHTQLLENNDHLGKNILDVRRDILELSKQQQQQPSKRSSDIDVGIKKPTQWFEWDVGNLDTMVKNRQSYSSQSYIIADYKIVGGIVCLRDGRLSVKISGDYAHVKTSSSETKIRDFDCAVYLVDKAGMQSDLLLSRVAVNFNKEREWMAGEIPACDVKLRGFSARDGNVHLKFLFDVCG